MCDPITAASAALQAGGMAASAIGSNAAARARSEALQRNYGWQLADIQKAFGQVDAARGQYENFAPGMAARGAQLGDVINANVARNTPPSAMAPTTSTATNDAIAAKGVDTAARTAQRGAAQANNMSFGDYLQSTNMNAQRNIETANMYNNFARGWASTLPGELDQANKAAGAWPTIGALAGGLGQLGVSYGINKAGGLGNLFGGSSPIASVPAVQPPNAPLSPIY